MNSADQHFAANLETLGCLCGETITEEQVGRLIRYARLLQQWNQKMNLTTVTDDGGIAVKHFQDAMTVLPAMDQLACTIKEDAAALRLIDVGSGAGLPGLPLIIMRPGWHAILLDALAKRIRFLEEAIIELDLSTVTALHGRAEDAARQPDLREQFDLAIARAVAPLAVLAEYCLPFVRVGGLFIAMKGRSEREWPQAKRAISLLGGHLENLQIFNLPGTDQQRSLFWIRKKEPVSAAYPRKAGTAQKRPL